MAKSSATLAERFWPKVDNRGPDDCWVWIAALNERGYGAVGAGVGKRIILAHRASWELHFGSIPRGLWVLHRCDNPPCVNPSHLFLGTQADNHADMLAKGRGDSWGWSKGRPGLNKGEANPAARLTEEQVRDIRRLYAAGGFSYRTLGEQFGVGHGCVASIVRRENWRDI